jgi:DeoR family transcriptional regulator, deoxyribose operon repressor
MTRAERLDRILHTLEIAKASSVQELSHQLEVSHMTVRRDLAALEEDDLVKVLHGSVILHPRNDQRTGEAYYSLIAAGSEHQAEKQAIAMLAASLIEPEDSLIIDAGSTTEYFSKCLPEDRSYTVLCYALNIVAETVRRKNCRTLFAGGAFHENTLMFESPEGLDMIRGYRATKAFISAAGVSDRYGVTCMNPYERETKKAVIRSSMRKILLVDSSKFGTMRSDYFADLADIDELVTDRGIPGPYADAARELGIVLRIA